MNSTELKEKIKMKLLEGEAELIIFCIHDTDPYIQMVFDSILFNCLKIKEQIEDIRRKHISFFSTFSNQEKAFVEKIDVEVWLAMERIWVEENSWCCDRDFEDDMEDWLYVRRIFKILIEVIEYAERTYGVFSVVDC